MNFKHYALSAALFAGISLAAAPYVWLERLESCNFNQSLDWPVLTGKQAAAVFPGGKEIPAVPEFRFRFSAPQAAVYQLWGRTFDPKWSSPGRWRIDSGEWREWKPGKAVSRVVFNKNFPIEWHSWGDMRLDAGEHTLEFEVTGKRAHGDYVYFILDALALSSDAEYVPEGNLSVAEEADTLFEAVKGRPGAEAAHRLAATDVDGLRQLRRMKLEAERSELRSTAPDQELLHGKVVSLELDNREFRLEVEWDRPRSGRYWVGVTQDGALYAWHAGESESAARKLRIAFPRPEKLPAGRLSVTVVPLDDPWAFTAPESGFVAEGAAVRPSAWGIFRDRDGIAHPWSVNECNLLFWEGKPFLPFGGMINSRASWASKTGQPGSDFLDAGLRMVEEQFKLLKKYGVDEVYFNGFFLHANPNYMRKLVALTEKYGMKYGLEVTSVPEHSGKGFVRHKVNRIPLKGGETAATIETSTAYPTDKKPKGSDNTRYDAPHRCLWVLLDAAGNPLETGMGVLQPGKAETAGITPLSLAVKFRKAAPAGAALAYLPEVTLSRSDPAGYLEGLSDYIVKLRAVYGSLRFGPNLRFFIDPLQNEMHFQPEAVPTGAEFRRRYAEFLLNRYDSAAALGRAWGVAQPLSALAVAARLVPLWEEDGVSLWIDPETGTECRMATKNASTALRDLKEFRGRLCMELISQLSDELKRLADVPVLVKHNIWFSDWFVNTKKQGGFDGIGMESYCYGDSLAYHNSLVAQAENMQSARNQWSLVTESSAAAFEGQKDYCGYLDRLQMMNDIDLLTLYGAKGFYHFGFSFDPGAGKFYTTDLLRDPRQLEWLHTIAATHRAAAEKLGAYRPELYGWYPAYLRERLLVDAPPRPFDIDATYMGRATQIRMAPDGRWIVPAVNLDSPWKGVLADLKKLTPEQEKTLTAAKVDYPVWKLGATVPLESFTASGRGVIAPAAGNPDRLDQFRRNVLGIRVFQTAAVNGVEFADGRILVWVAVECADAALRLPAGAEAKNLAGKPLSVESGVLALKREPYVKSVGKRPAHLDSGYFYDDNGQPEAAFLSGVKVDEILKENAPAFQRWLPRAVSAGEVVVFREAEAFDASTFNQPSIEGYSRYSAGRAVGINTHWMPPAGKFYEVEYEFELDRATSAPVFHLRRQVDPALDLEVRIDGRAAGTIPAKAEVTDALHLSPWNAGLSRNNLTVGWTKLPLPALGKGKHKLTLRVIGDAEEITADTKLLGGDAERRYAAEYGKTRLFALQLDCWLIAR